MSRLVPHPPVAFVATLLLILGLGVSCSRGAADEATAKPAGPAAASAPATPMTAKPAAPAAKPGAAAPAGDATQDASQQILQPDQLPAVVARVDGTEISKDDLLARASEARGAMAQRGMPQPPPSRAFYRQVLDDIVGNRLLVADLTAQGKAATPDEVKQQIASMRAQYPSDDAFQKALTGHGFDQARLEKYVGEGVTVDKWVRNTVVPSVMVTDAEKKQFYDENKSKMIEPEKVHARHILISVPKDATPEQKADKRKQIEAIRAKLAAGGDFEATAKQVSDDKGSAERGGDLGWFYRGQMVPAFEQAAFSLAPGKISDVVETPFGFHLIEVVEKQPEAQLDYDKVSAKIEALLKQRQLEQKVKSRVNELAAKAKIEILI